MNEVNADNIVLWLCRLFGVLNRAAFGLILTFGSLVRLVRTILFAGWLLYGLNGNMLNIIY